MSNNRMVALAKRVVVERYRNDNWAINNEDVFIVWFSKTLQNWKALVSTCVGDGMYYEITYNGDKNEIYLDAYKKIENKCIPLSVEVNL